MRFTYTVGKAGWADASIDAHGSSAKLLASYLTDALGDLLAAVLAMLDGSETATLVWEEEPGQYVWTFERVEEQVLLRIVGSEIRDLRSDDQFEYLRDGVLFETLEPMADIASAIAAAADEVDRETGQWKYWKSWGMAFPAELLWKVKRRLANPLT